MRFSYVPAAAVCIACGARSELVKFDGSSPADASAATDRDVAVLAGGTQGWIASGPALEQDHQSWISRPDDVYKRPYEGTDNATAAMQAYIDWELHLVAQLANDCVSNFHVV